MRRLRFASFQHMALTKRLKCSHLVILMGLFLVFLMFARQEPSVHDKYTPAHIDQHHKQAPDTLNFFVIGDWGLESSLYSRRVASQMELLAKRMDISFVISTGDNMYPFGIQSADDPRMKSVFEDVYSSLGLTWYPIVGNHDCRGNVHAQVDYSKLNDQWNFPSPYYSLHQKMQGRDLYLFFLETCSLVCPPEASNPKEFPQCEYLNRDGHFRNSSFLVDYPTLPSLYQAKQRQLKWLNDSLAAVDEDAWKVVIGHNPVYSASGHHGDNKVLINDLLPILNQQNVDAFFSGHDHTLQHIRFDNQNSKNFFVSGGGGYFKSEKSEHEISANYPQKDAVKFATTTRGVMLTSVTHEQILVSIIDSKGQVMYKTAIKKT